MPVRAIGRASFIGRMLPKKTILIGCAVAALTAAVFSINGRNAFVRLDDLDYVAKNPFMERGLTRPFVRWAFLSVGYASNWHPLTWISHAADVTIARKLGLDGDEPKKKWGVWAKMDSAFTHFQHWENILLHAFNAFLLWLLMIRLCGKENARTGVMAALFTLFWAVHPLRVEVVAWISERKELLSVMFMLLTLLAYLRAQKPLQGKWMRSLLPVGFFICALLAKPVAVSLPALIFAWEWVGCRRTFREAFDRTLPYVLLSAFTCFFTMHAQTDAREIGDQMSRLNTVTSVLASPAVYLRQTLLPYDLTMDYLDPEFSRDWPYALAGVLLLLAMAGSCVWWLVKPNRWNRLATLTVAWSYLGLLPMIGIVRVGTEPHSDRYTYWVGCGAVVALFFAAQYLEARWRPFAKKGFVAFAVVLAVYSGWAIHRSTYWKDSVRLFSDAVEKSHSDDLVIFLMDEYCLTGGVDGIKKAGELIRSHESNTPAARAGLALYLSRISYAGGDTTNLDEARLFAEGAIEDDPYCRYAYAALGIVYNRLKDYPKAAENLEKAFLYGYENPELQEELKSIRERLEKGKEGK